MKKRQVVIELIEEFILKKPNRPYKEVEQYAVQFKATYEEIEQAIHDASTKVNSRKQTGESTPKLSLPSFNPLLLPAPVKFGGVFAILLVFSTFLFVFINNNERKTYHQSNSVLSMQVEQETTAQEKETPADFHSYEKVIDAKKVFSYPSSNVSLKFSGTLQKEVLGFFPYWMVDQIGEIDLDGFTSISLFALEADGKGNIVIEDEHGLIDPGWAMWNNINLDALIKKAKEKRIKVYLTIKSFDKNNIENISTSDEAQKTLIANAVQLTGSKNLNGINIDFEYLGEAPENVTSGFTRFIANLNTELKRQLPKAHLSIDTYLGSAASKDFFDIQLLKDNLDAIVVMGYDVSTPHTDPGPLAPMEGEKGILGYIQSYLERVPAEKIILAVAYYGYDWRVNSSNGSQGNAAILPYAEIAANVKSYRLNWDETWQTPFYRYTDENSVNHEVHFENTRSLGVKYDYIKDRNLKGVGIWAIGYDGHNQELQQLLLDKFAR